MSTTIPSPSPYPAPLVGTSSAQVAQVNPTRASLWVFNPSASATLAISPTGATAILNGANSITLAPGTGVDLENFTNGLNAIASAPSSPITIWEYYN